MLLSEIRRQIQESIRQTAEAKFGIEISSIAAEVPPKPNFGDLAFPVAFDVAKKIKQSTGEKLNPREIAQAIADSLANLTFVARAEVAGAGYLNVFLDRAAFLASSRAEPLLPNSGAEILPKACVEHTSVNPNKAAHIGHVRNSVLGDTFARILRAIGRRVEVQNYIDNTGVQVADVVIGFLYLEKMALPAIKALDARLAGENISFDYYCWDLYTKVGRAYLNDANLSEKRAEVLHAIEAGNNPIAEIADYVATRNVECILQTMERLSIKYDLLPRESEILHLHFWDNAFERMKELGVIRYETEGKNSGCWVMPFESHESSEEHEADKILVRSNGTVTYTGKDIAYQMWKLGILGMDFHYRRFHKYSDGHWAWITTTEPNPAEPQAPEFGHGTTVYNVIDSRQSYPQEVVRKGVAAIDPKLGLEASIHLAYEMVALSPAAAEELGFKLSEEDRKRPFIEMSGRKGLGVKADDLISRLEQNALSEVESRHPSADEEEKRRIAHQIAVGALRYFLLKFTRNTAIVFDFREALSFDGETGCFCQYSAVRANSIFRKLSAMQTGAREERARLLLDREAVNQVFDADTTAEIWSILLMASRLEETTEAAAAQAEPAIVAKYTFQLAKAFNLFYHHHKIISEPDAVKRAVLIEVADAARRALSESLALMGIEVPAKM
ncbi:MAG: arginine--tRNA ligase [Blastocatellia bacterium]